MAHRTTEKEPNRVESSGYVPTNEASQWPSVTHYHLPHTLLCYYYNEEGHPPTYTSYCHLDKSEIIARYRVSGSESPTVQDMHRVFMGIHVRIKNPLIKWHDKLPVDMQKSVIKISSVRLCLSMTFQVLIIDLSSFQVGWPFGDFPSLSQGRIQVRLVLEELQLQAIPPATQGHRPRRAEKVSLWELHQGKFFSRNRGSHFSPVSLSRGSQLLAEINLPRFRLRFSCEISADSRKLSH